MEISEIKSRLSITAVLTRYGLYADRNPGSRPGQAFRLRCPFHNDKTPSMQVYPETNTVYCFSSNCKLHGKAIDQIDFIMHMEAKNGSFSASNSAAAKHEAINKAKEWAGHLPKPPKSKPADLGKLFTTLKHNLSKNSQALNYLKERALEYGKLEMGYNAIRPRSKEAYQNLKGCIIFPLKDREGKVVSLYGRSVLNDRDKRHFYLKSRQGLYPGYPEARTKKLILTESIIDAASLLQLEKINKEYEILSLYGTNGLTEEHTEAIKAQDKLEEVIFFLNGDEAGRKSTEKYSQLIKDLKPAIKITQVPVPEDEDVNSLIQGHQAEILTHLINKRTFIFSSEKSSNENKKEDTTSRKKQEPALDTSNPLKLSYKTDTAIYYVQGGIKSDFDSMKVTLVIQHPKTKKKSRNKLDLYEDRQVEKAAREAGEKLQLRSDLLEADIYELTDHLDNYRESRQSEEPTADSKPQYPLTAHERKQAEELLKTPNLLTKLNELIGKSGVVGEEAARLFLFVIASSYKMPDTLHGLVQGSTGSGKTHLIVKISSLMPPEEVKFLTRVTESSFYNYGEYELKNTLFCMEDLDGLKEEAFLAFRELQSREQLTSSTSEKDEKGNIRARIRTVKGPIGSLSATTKGEIYEDNMSRCFLVSVDESPEQTQRIIDYQNRKSSGAVNKEEEKETIALLRNCIRILKPLEVINPYAGQVTLPEEAHKIRRLNDLYQSFVRQVTLINQYRRNQDTKGRLIAEKEDLEGASEIMFDSIMLKVDELDGSLRQFYERLKGYVEGKGKEYKNYSFGRKEIRDALRVSKTQQHRFFNDLLELEYISQHGSNSYRGYKYKIVVWDDIKALRSKIKRYLQGQLNQLQLF